MRSHRCFGFALFAIGVSLPVAAPLPLASFRSAEPGLD